MNLLLHLVDQAVALAPPNLDPEKRAELQRTAMRVRTRLLAENSEVLEKRRNGIAPAECSIESHRRKARQASCAELRPAATVIAFPKEKP